MSDENALLRAIGAHPDEDTPRLAYADWLDEHDQPERAAFVRGQIEYTQLKDDSPRRREVAFRCRQLLDAHENDWLAAHPFGRDWHWARGFVESFTSTPEALHGADADLFDTHPFRRLWLWELNGDAAGVHLIPAGNRLAALDLIGNRLNTNALKKLAKAAHLPHLRELGLMFNALRDTAIPVLCGEPFFQRLDVLRLGANPFTDEGRARLRTHFGRRVTFAHDREPERLYTLQDDYLRVGWGNDLTQFFLQAGEHEQRLAVFDHAGALLGIERREVVQKAGANYQQRYKTREAARDQWLAELGYTSATIKVKRFQFGDGSGLTPFNWWAEMFDQTNSPERPGLNEAIDRWLGEGQYRFAFGGSDVWFDRNGEVTDT
ncbi:MAG: TIGR02996 domain-containing protein [Planctomycetes bacterium]|nr:TIGR02996 domain-containing protein [Planctomycetota bacterium]